MLMVDVDSSIRLSANSQPKSVGLAWVWLCIYQTNQVYYEAPVSNRNCDTCNGTSESVDSMALYKCFFYYCK